MRASLVKSGALGENKTKNLYEFTSDYMFNNPSYAAVSIVGGAKSGNTKVRISVKWTSTSNL